MCVCVQVWHKAEDAGSTGNTFVAAHTAGMQRSKPSCCSLAVAYLFTSLRRLAQCFCIAAFGAVVQGLLHITHLDLSFSLSGKSLPIPGTSSGDIALASQVKLRPAAQFAEELRSAIAKLHSLQGVCQYMLGMIPVLAFG